MLDNFTDEAQEMYKHNKWINYTLPLHRMREMGFSNRIFDLLDERSLTIDEVREFCFLIFGSSHFDGVPEPSVDMKGFLKKLDKIVGKEQKQWHPMKRKLRPLVDVEKIAEIHGEGCTIM